jgi:hypothetical protein
MSRLQKIEVTVNEAMSQAVAQFIEAGTVKSKGVNALETAVVQYIEAKREKLDMRVLKPFIKTGMVSQIRVGRAL